MPSRKRTVAPAASAASEPERINPEQALLDQLIGLLEAGASPWQRPWSSGIRYQNLVSRHAFTGGNPALLAMQCAARGSTARLFATVTQARSKGWYPVRGSKAFRIFQPVPVTVQSAAPDNPQGGGATGAPGAAGEGGAGGGSRSFVKYRCIPIFAANDLAGDGIEEAVAAVVAAQSDTFTVQPAACLERLSPWEAHIKRDPAGDRAFYAPALDRITLPAPERFARIEHYGATLCHELIHLSGHRSRLARPGITEPQPFGSLIYAEEELIAEIGAFLLCEELGIGSVIEHHASYLDSWLQVLSRGPRALTSSLSAAARAAKLILPPATT